MVSFTFCSTLAHIVRRYELGDRRALNILNWPTKAHDEDFDEADFCVIFNDDVLKDIAQVRFSVSHLCLSYTCFCSCSCCSCSCSSSCGCCCCSLSWA